MNHAPTPFPLQLLGGALASLALAGPALGRQTDSAEPFPPATPESQGLSSAALAELTRAVEGYLERGLLVGGELLVIQNRHTVLHEVFGFADREKERAWTKGTVCNIRSMTKTLTGAAAQILIDRGVLAEDDPAAKYLPGFDRPASRTITLRQILGHRAGLPLTILTSMDAFENLIEMGNAVGERGPEFEPDSRFWYSDAGTEALGAIVAVASEQRLDEFVSTELLEPLGMSESFYDLDGEDPRRSRIASLYIGSPGNWQRFLDPEEKPFYPFAWGSQSLYSTPMDYARFLAMWMDGGRVGERVLLSEQAIARTLTPRSEMSMLGSEARFPTSFHGLEVYYGEMAVLHVPVGSHGEAPAVILGHSGSDGTIAWAWPGRDLMVLYFTQSRGGGSALRLEEVLDRVLISPQAHAADAVVPEELAPYLGTYVADWANHMREEFVVHVKDGHLAIDIPSQLDFELVPGEEDGRWRFAIVPELSAWFERDEAGDVDCLRIQQGSLVFEAPRKDSPHAREFREANRAREETVGRFLGVYDDPEVEGDARVFIDGDYLAIEGGGGMRFHLWKVPVEDAWVVRENPAFTVTFQTDSDIVVSFTRRSMDGSQLVFERLE